MQNAPAQRPWALVGVLPWQEEDKQDGVVGLEGAGTRTSWYPASERTHAGQQEGGPQDAFSICRASSQQHVSLPSPWSGEQGEAFSSCFPQDIPATADSWFPLGS